MSCAQGRKIAEAGAALPSAVGSPGARLLGEEYVWEKLQWDLEAEHVKVEDTTSNRCASSFRVLMVSSKFEGKPLLQRHWLVNMCLVEELLHIHVCELKILTPEQ
ncbi:hypothetical protein MC885_002802 [Smutsia gigantea]|nr:hypothetical protein MC885_002802 [Smutsia gigantea]